MKNSQVQKTEVLVKRILCNANDIPMLLVYGVRINVRTLRIYMYPVLCDGKEYVFYPKHCIEERAFTKGSDIKPDIITLNEFIARLSIRSKSGSKFDYFLMRDDYDILKVMKLLKRSISFTDPESGDNVLRYRISEVSNLISKITINKENVEKEYTPKKGLSLPTERKQYPLFHESDPFDSKDLEYNHEPIYYMKFFDPIVGIRFKEDKYDEIYICIRTKYSYKYFCHAIKIHRRYFNPTQTSWTDNAILNSFKVEKRELYHNASGYCATNYALYFRDMLFGNLIVKYKEDNSKYEIQSIEISMERFEYNGYNIYDCKLLYKNREFKYYDGTYGMIEYIDEFEVDSINSNEEN